jgi:hypothetical protein
LLEKKDFFDSLPKNIRKHLMTNYLYDDLFIKHKIFNDFFDNGEMLDSQFLYDISFGFLPRQFRNLTKDDKYDKIIY